MPQSISSALPSHPPSSDGGNFRTDNLELASFLLAREHRLIGAVPSGRLVVFEFEPSADLGGRPKPANEGHLKTGQ